jgi:hypothetical protein
MTGSTSSGSIRRHVLAILVGLTSAGCAPEESELTGTAREPALTANALTGDALRANTLAADTLSTNTVSALGDPGAAGTLARKLLRYAVGCALRSDQSFAFTWMDATGVEHAEAYPGQMGLAPYWATQPLDTAGRQWVSACIAARVNAFGVTVPLSMRGAHPALATMPDEAAAYPTREATFFGDLFSTTPAAYACYDPTTTDLAVLHDRVCAQPTSALLAPPDCGPIQVLGQCFELVGQLDVGRCASEDAGLRYFYDCAPSPGAGTMASVTTFLAGLL